MKQYKHAPALINSWLTSFYDPVVNLFGVGTTLQRKTLQVISLNESHNFLDIGCGTGTLANLTKAKYPDVSITALDPDERILSIARSKAEQNNLDIKFIKAGAEKLPFSVNSFDFIVSSLAFHHLPTDIKKQALREISRVLRPKGTFLLVDIGKPKNMLWKILLTIESIVEPKEYIKDNLDGKLPLFMKETGFDVKEIGQPYFGIQYLQAKKKD